MTSYDAYKKKETAKTSATTSRKNNARFSSLADTAGRIKGNIASEKSVSADVDKKNAQRTKSVSVRRDRSHTMPEMVRMLKLPAILGFAQKRKFHTDKIKTVSKYPLAVAIALIMLVTVMFMMLVVNAVNISNMKTKTTELNVQLEQLIEKKEELNLELEKRDDLRYIEEIAKNQFGMIKKDYVTKYYISMGNEDKIEFTDNTSSEPEATDSTAEQ